MAATPNNLLFFLHLPKTAGLSLIDYLDQQFAPAQICPLHSDPDFTLFAELPRENRQQYRLVHGHFLFGAYDRGICQYLAPNPVRLTMLRKPLDRTISAYRHCLRKAIIPASMSFAEFVRDPEQAFRVRNVQARLIVGAIDEKALDRATQNDRPDAELLRLAKEHLSQFAWVGLTEAFTESLELLAYTFGWEMPASIPHENGAPDELDWAALGIDQSTLNDLQSAWQVDEALYQFAKDLFQRQRSQMASELFAQSRRYGISVHLPSFLQRGSKH